MLIFLDDSGDTGFKIAKGSSQVFVIVLVIFDDTIEAEETALKIKKLRRELGYSEDFEFKFNKCSKEVRCKFLNTVANSKFHVRAIVMDKSKIYGEELRRSKKSFYNYTVKMVLQHHGGTIADAKLHLDGRGDREFKNSLSTYLRRELNPGIRKENKIIDDLKFVDSKKNVLIQLADMVAGAIHRSYNHGKEDRTLYKGIIQKRIEDVWNFGRR
ncbi:MAG: hypothetical protein A3E19_04950 [Planctomycetes bacterium RIFCSPHIGHO2_12_FULL_52_36]|nr:MAG: hypothetical protein A3E19_04950 [Planctomycetes bacterium RIFCSPHIGHO2_12_FULL_52_36]